MFKWFDTRKTNLELRRFYNAGTLHNMVVSVATDVGRIRTNNEDAACVFAPLDKEILTRKGYLIVLADGMGGHNSGEVASEMALDTLSGAYYKCKGNVLKSLKQAVSEANQAIYDASVTHAAYRGMGTTCTVVVVKEDELFLAQVGDSRAYFFKANEIIQLSKDQTLVQHKIDTGQIKPEEAATDPERNVLTNALGTKPFIDAEIKRLQFPWGSHACLLLCSDGLYEYVSKAEMTDLLSEEKNIEQAASELIERAKTRGGHDNITVVIASFDGRINNRAVKDTNPG